jgi:hypothetical protein
VIIKLIPIKTKTRLSAVINYIATDKGRIEDHRKQGIFHNIKHKDLENIQNEFEHNYHEYASKRSNGNIAMHGIVSIHPTERDKIDLEKMDDITQTLLNKAYPQALSFGTHHLSENHRHSHFIVSANDFMSKTSTRLSKQRLFEVHKHMLEYVKEKYPQLKTHIDISQWGKKLNNEKDYYMKKRNPEVKLTKEELKERINEILSFSHSSKEFFALLEFEGFKTYSRNEKVQGILFGENEQKIRLSRLSIEHEQLDEIDKWNERLEELGKINPNAKESILEQYSYGQSEKGIYEQIEKYEVDEQLKTLEGKEELKAVDHYTYDLNDISSSPTGMNLNEVYDTEVETKTSEQELDEEFSRIMNLPIQSEEKETDIQNDLNVVSDNSEMENDSQDLDDEIESENDINDLENETNNELDDDMDFEL